MTIRVITRENRGSNNLKEHILHDSKIQHASAQDFYIGIASSAVRSSYIGYRQQQQCHRFVSHHILIVLPIHHFRLDKMAEILSRFHSAVKPDGPAH